MNISEGASVIDIGCGHGKNTRCFVERNFETCGIDISETAIEHCRNRIKRAQFVCADITKIDPLLLGTFNVLIDAGCLHVNPKKLHHIIIKKYKKLVRTNGKIFIRIFNNPSNAETPLFHVEDLPVYGYSRAALVNFFSDIFVVQKMIFENKYGPWGIFYLYMKNIQA